MTEAQEDLLLLCNDDIAFDPSYVDFAARLLRLPIGIAAPDPRSVTRRGSSPLRWARPTYRRSYAYGILMALRKDSYVPIPDDLLISSGDTFLFDRQSRRNIHIKGFRIETEMSTTSGGPEFSRQKYLDKRAFEQNYAAGTYSQRFWLGHSLSMLERAARERTRGFRRAVRIGLGRVRSAR